MCQALGCVPQSLEVEECGTGRSQQTLRDLAEPSFLKDESCCSMWRDWEQVEQNRGGGAGQQWP